MKKFSILIQMRFLYIYLLLYMIVGYFYNSKIKKLGFYSFIEDYFGYFIFGVLFLILLNIFSFFIKCKKRKMVYSIRVKFFAILGVSSLFLWGVYKLHLPFEKVLADEEILQRAVELFVYEYKLGVILSFIFNYCIGRIYFNYLYILLYSLIFISLFFLLAKRVRITITTIIANRREKKRREIERKLVQEQIELMEALERKEKLKNETIESEEKREDDISI